MATVKQGKVEVVKHSMDLDERIDLHKRGWKIQRVGWVVILALMAAAALGVFGEGIASKKTVSIGNSQLKYDRFLRYESEMMLQFRLEDGADSTVISFSQGYLKYLRVEHIVPGPKANYTRAGKVFYVFDGSPPMEVAFYIVPEKPGTLKGEVGVNNANTYLSQFIYP